ncbi:hypothetical protein JCM19274_3066 [Algibacter lectus]|uniref:Uncharacterized protein n=1 Tax=Algibacter lectus TaxID=221126 RepID=A0A090WW65_9FLAO|nr:hypothetical protein JCM19274_3066 [Algibacter lectus]
MYRLKANCSLKNDEVISKEVFVSEGTAKWIKALVDGDDELQKEKDKEHIQKEIFDSLSELFKQDDQTLSKVIIDFSELQDIHVKVKYVNASDELDIEGLKEDEEFGGDYKDSVF